MMKTTKKIKWKIIIALMQKVKSQQFSYCLATFDDWPTFSLCFFAHPPKKKKKNCHTVVLLALGCLPPSFLVDPWCLLLLMVWHFRWPRMRRSGLSSGLDLASASCSLFSLASTFDSWPRCLRPRRLLCVCVNAGCWCRDKTMEW